VKKNGSSYYHGKFGHYGKECKQTKFSESKYSRHEGNFVDREVEVSDDKLLILVAALSIEIDDCNAWFINSRVSTYMT